MNCYSSDRSVTRSYYRGAAGALLVYDIAKYVKPLFIYCCYSVELKIFVYQWLQNWQVDHHPRITDGPFLFSTGL